MAPRAALALSGAGVFVCLNQSLLPDYLAPSLQIIFIGLNPGTYSDKKGHYFARPTNSFWTALYESGLVPFRVGPEDDVRMNEFGYGLTDLVARVTPNIDSLTRDEYVAGGKLLRAKIEPLAPRVACFVGITGYRAAFNPRALPGTQESPVWGTTRLFIVPSTSPRNAYYRPDVIAWFKELKRFMELLNATPTAV